MTEPDGDILVTCDYFEVRRKPIPGGGHATLTAPGEFAIAAVAFGTIATNGREFRAGDFFLIPASASLAARGFVSTEGAEVLVTGFPAAKESQETADER